MVDASPLTAPVVVDAERWLPEIVRRLVEAAQPSAIWLFGSRARGDHRPDSDVDLLVVVPRVTPENRVETLAQLLAALGTIPVPVDLVALSEAEFAAGRDAWGTLAHEAWSRGRRLYAA